MIVKVGACLLSDLLEKNKMSQSELAEKIDSHRQTINSYASNRRKMSLETAKNIALVLNCDVDDLYEWKVSEWTVSQTVPRPNVSQLPYKIYYTLKSM